VLVSVTVRVGAGAGLVAAARVECATVVARWVVLCATWAAVLMSAVGDVFGAALVSGVVVVAAAGSSGVVVLGDVGSG
jgi:hypothetical protein